MLDPGAARVHSCQGQPGVREGARVDFRPSVPSQPHLRQLQSRFPSISNRPATWITPVPHLPQPATPRQLAYPVTPSPHHTSLVTELETAKQQIKAELKLHVKVKFDQLTDTVTSLTQMLTEVTKQNKDMKSQIGDLKKYISVIKTGLAKQQTPAAVEIQEPSAPKVPVNNTSVNVETSNMFSVLSGGGRRRPANTRELFQLISRRGHYIQHRSQPSTVTTQRYHRATTKSHGP